MKKLKRKIISAITAFAFICSMGINTAQAATRLTTAHLYHWAKTANTVRLTQFQRYINLPDKNNNTALCLAQQAKNRNAYKLLLEYGASTDVECHDDDDPICAIVAGDKVKVSVRFRGRERDYTAKGMDVMNQFAEIVSDVAEVEKKPNFEGRSLMMVLAPKTDKK